MADVEQCILRSFYKAVGHGSKLSLFYKAPGLLQPNGRFQSRLFRRLALPPLQLLMVIRHSYESSPATRLSLDRYSMAASYNTSMRLALSVSDRSLRICPAQAIRGS